MNILSRILLIIASVSLLNGCSAIDKSIKHGTLDVQTRMSETVFLDPVADDKKTVILQIRNTSDKKDLEIFDGMQSKIAKVVNREINLPVITQVQFEMLLLGEKNILKIGFSKHKIKVNFLD